MSTDNTDPSTLGRKPLSSLAVACILAIDRLGHGDALVSSEGTTFIVLDQTNTYAGGGLVLREEGVAQDVANCLNIKTGRLILMDAIRGGAVWASGEDIGLTDPLGRVVSRSTANILRENPDLIVAGIEETDLEALLLSQAREDARFRILGEVTLREGDEFRSPDGRRQFWVKRSEEFNEAAGLYMASTDDDKPLYEIGEATDLISAGLRDGTIERIAPVDTERLILKAGDDFTSESGFERYTVKSGPEGLFVDVGLDQRISVEIATPIIEARLREGTLKRVEFSLDNVKPRRKDYGSADVRTPAEIASADRALQDFLDGEGFGPTGKVRPDALRERLEKFLREGQ